MARLLKPRSVMEWFVARIIYGGVKPTLEEIRQKAIGESKEYYSKQLKTCRVISNMCDSVEFVEISEKDMETLGIERL